MAALQRAHGTATTTATTTDGHSHLQQCGGKFLKLRPEGSFYRWCLACLLSRLAGYRQALGSGKKAELNWLEILKWLALSIHVENYASRVEHYQKIDNSCFVVSTRRRWLHAYVLGPRDYKALPLPLSHRMTATAPPLHTSHMQAAAKRVTSSPRPSHRYLRPNDRCVIEGNHFLLLCTALPSQLLCLNEMVTYRQAGNQVDIH